MPSALHSSDINTDASVIQPDGIASAGGTHSTDVSGLVCYPDHVHPGNPVLPVAVLSAQFTAEGSGVSGNVVSLTPSGLSPGSTFLFGISGNLQGSGATASLNFFGTEITPPNGVFIASGFLQANINTSPLTGNVIFTFDTTGTSGAASIELGNVAFSGALTIGYSFSVSSSSSTNIPFYSAYIQQVS